MFSSNSPSLQNTVKGLVSFPVALAIAVGSLVTGPAAQASGEAPSILKDINQSTKDGLDPFASGDAFTEMDGYLYFISNEDDLWKTDGTESGTVLVKEFSLSAPLNLHVFQNRLYFGAQDAENGRELWSSDGTTEGTELLLDINVGAGSSSPASFAEMNGDLYFAASNGTNGNELWKTDGTASGTNMVKDIYAGSSWSTPQQLTAVGSTLYFTATDSTNGRELWKSDGTADGTSLVKNIRSSSSSSNPTELLALNGTTILFGAYNGTRTGLWKSTGTAENTTEIFTYSPGYLTKLGSEVFFAASKTEGSELWVTDGTTTTLVKDINPGSSSSSPKYLMAHDGELYFAAEDGVNGRQVWISDGTTSGTTRLSGISGATAGSDDVYEMTVLGDEIFFVVETPALWREVWKVSALRTGAPHVASNVKDILDGALDTGNGPRGLAVLGSKIVFVAADLAHGHEIWSTDGTDSGTSLVKDVNAEGNDSLDSLDMLTIGDNTFFVADDGVHGTELWKTNGTAEGTVMVKDIRTGPSGASPSDLTAFDSKLFFSANDGVNGRELWESDGTEAGTQMVKAIQSPSDASLNQFTVVGSTLFFVAHDVGEDEGRLWKTDGTADGTVLVKDVNPGDEEQLEALTAVGSTLFFTADDGTNGWELWKSDGSTGGTVMVKDIDTSGSSSPNNLVEFDSMLFFQADDGSTGDELWKSDGTTSGTVMVKDIRAGADAGDPRYFAVVGESLFFRARDTANGRELWKSDGTEAGTVLVKDIYPGSSGSSPFQLTAVGSTLFFRADDGTNGTELWKSDGTPEGTQMVKDLNSNGSSNPTDFVASGNELFFTADVDGDQVWRSDGSPSGTTLIHDVRPGFTGGPPSGISIVGSTVYLIGYQAATGYELWRLIDVADQGVPNIVAKPYYGPIVQSVPKSAQPGDLITVTGKRLDTIASITVGDQTVEATDQTSEQLTFRAPDIQAGNYQVRFSAPASNVVLFSSFQIMEGPVNLSDDDLGKVNVGSFNGKLVVYALGLDGARITWKVGGIWGQDYASSDALNRFDRLTPRKGVTVKVDIYVDGVKRLTKSVLTR